MPFVKFFRISPLYTSRTIQSLVLTAVTRRNIYYFARRQKRSNAGMNIQESLSKRINMPEIKSVASWASGSQENIAILWSLARSEDRMTCVNALWSMTHLPATDAKLLLPLRDEMIDMLLVETDTGKKRMLLQLLREQEYCEEDVRTDFLDYCLSKINSECESCSIRCFSIYAAYKMCRHFPELITELERHLDMMRYQTLSPGLTSAFRHTKSKIAQLRKSNGWQ